MTTRYRNPKHHGMHKTKESWMGKHNIYIYIYIFSFLKLLAFSLILSQGLKVYFEHLRFNPKLSIGPSISLDVQTYELGTWASEISPERALRNASGYGQNCQCKSMQRGFLGTGLLIPLMADLLVSTLFQNFLSIVQHATAMFQKCPKNGSVHVFRE